MSLFAIRKQLVDETGRNDLVVNTTAYVDAGANFHIRAGTRTLDSIQDTPKTFATYQKDTAVDDYKIVFKNNRSISSVRVTDGVTSTSTDDGRTLLTKVSRDWLKEEYAGAVAGVTSGRPKYWIPAIIGLAPQQSTLQPALVANSPELLQNGNFDTPAFWTLSGSEFTIESGKLVSAASAAITATSDDIRLVPGKSYLVAFTVTDRTASDVTVSLGGKNGTARSTNATFSESIVAGTTNLDLIFTTGTTFDGKIDSVSVKENVTNAYTGDFTYDFEEAELGDSHWGDTGIQFMPPADIVYTIIVEGRWWSRPLYNDWEENYWSFNHPDVLIQATMMSLEKFRRNTAGVNDMRRALLEQLRGIDTDLSSNDIAGVDFISETMEERL